MEWEFIRLKTNGNLSEGRNKIPVPTKPFILLSFILLTSVIYFIFVPLFNDLSIKSKIDPNLYDVLDSGNSVDVYISGYNLHLSNCKRVWQFGNLTICKTIIKSKSELEQIASNNKVLSIYMTNYRATFPMFKISNIKEYNFTDIDIDNTFLHVSGRYTGKGITIAVIDTGIDYLHPDFFKNNKTIIKTLVSCIYKSNNSCIVYNITNWNYTQLYNLYLWEKQYKEQYGEFVFLDESGHGTHVSGIIVGQGNINPKYKGIATDSELVIIKAFHSDGTATIENILDALEWCYYNCSKYNVKILSCSWGATIPSNGNDPITLAINKIVIDKKIWVFVAAGNSGNYPGSITVPAISDKVVTIGAWDCYKNKLAWFSSLGPTKTLNVKPDFVSCGVMIVAPKSQFVDFPDYITINNSYVALSGTSMATPTVSACAADFIEYYRTKYGRDPSLNDFIEFEKVNSIKLNFQKDWITGYGIIQCL